MKMAASTPIGMETNTATAPAYIARKSLVGESNMPATNAAAPSSSQSQKMATQIRVVRALR